MGGVDANNTEVLRGCIIFPRGSFQWAPSGSFLFTILCKIQPFVVVIITDMCHCTRPKAVFNLA